MLAGVRIDRNADTDQRIHTMRAIVACEDATAFGHRKLALAITVHPSACSRVCNFLFSLLRMPLLT